MFLINITCFAVATRCGGYTWPLLLLTASDNLFGNIGDARETAICSFMGITHISEKISRCC